ncbi:MBL fold metallo-hydrolase [Amphritea sp. HPY]|uniref:MBL fold metallo-hydrolase n=1 Tax=Amphritea sp. HPY TaxID=3421652 RepID=UPI003D7E01A5
MALSESAQKPVQEQLQTRKQKERAALDYPFPAPTADGQVVEVAPGVLWARMPMPMSLDHINVYLLDDGDGWFLIDTGLNTEASRDVWQTVAEQSFRGLPVKGLICTHFHYDHAGLARWLMEHFDAPLYMTHGEYYTLRALATSRGDMGSERQKDFYLRSGMSESQIDKMLKACQRDPFMGDYPPDFNRLREGQQLNIGGRNWQILIGEGHSPEHACLYCEQDSLLIAGDQLLPEISSNVLVSDVEPEADPLSLWLASLDKLSQIESDTLVMPSHGPVFKNVHCRVEQLHQHHQRQLDLVMKKARATTGFTAYEALKWMFDRELGAVETMLAQGETHAHLSWLLKQKELVRETGDAGVDRYSAAV